MISVTSSPGSEDGPTLFDWQEYRTANGSGPARVHANHTPEPPLNESSDLMTRGISGRAGYHLICQREPDLAFGEQVDDSIAWIDRMHADMEAAGYAVGALDLPACAADAPQERMRTFFVAHANRAGPSEQSGTIAVGPKQFPAERAGRGSRFGDHFSAGELGRNRRHEPSIRLLAYGVPNRVGKLRGFGNAIVPQVAAEFIQAALEAIEV